MIFGAHVIVYSKDATADRAFLRDVLGFTSVDAGHGWLIFALPPAEVAVHPAEENDRHELYFMCDDLKAEVLALAEKGVQCSDVQEARWGTDRQDRSSRGRRSRSLPAEASNGIDPLKLTRKPFPAQHIEAARSTPLNPENAPVRRRVYRIRKVEWSDRKCRATMEIAMATDSSVLIPRNGPTCVCQRSKAMVISLSAGAEMKPTISLLRDVHLDIESASLLVF